MTSDSSPVSSTQQRAIARSKSVPSGLSGLGGESSSGSSSMPIPPPAPIPASGSKIFLRESAPTFTIKLQGVEFDVTIKRKGGEVVKSSELTQAVWKDLKTQIEACAAALHAQDSTPFANVDKFSLKLAEGSVKIWNLGDDIDGAATKTVNMAKKYFKPFSDLSEALISRKLVQAFNTPSDLTQTRMGRGEATSGDLNASARDISNGGYLNATTVVHAMKRFEFDRLGGNAKFLHAGGTVLSEDMLTAWANGADNAVQDVLPEEAEIAGFNGRMYMPIFERTNNNNPEQGHYCMIVLDFENNLVYAYDPLGRRFQTNKDTITPALKKLSQYVLLKRKPPVAANDEGLRGVAARYGQYVKDAAEMLGPKLLNEWPIMRYTPKPEEAHQSGLSGANCGSFCLSAMKILEETPSGDNSKGRYATLAATSYSDDPTLEAFRQERAGKLRSFRTDVTGARGDLNAFDALDAKAQPKPPIVDIIGKLPASQGDGATDTMRIRLAHADALEAAGPLADPFVLINERKQSSDTQPILVEDSVARTNVVADNIDLRTDKAYHVTNATIYRKGLFDSYAELDAPRAGVDLLYTPIAPSLGDDEIKRIIYTQLCKAQETGHKHVVIGAWGRDWGYKDAKKIAQLYFEVIHTHFKKHFASITFAIPSSSGSPKETEYYAEFEAGLKALKETPDSLPIDTTGTVVPLPAAS